MKIAAYSPSTMGKGTVSLIARLDSDAAGLVFNYLDEPIDLARLTAVSRSCRRIVVEYRCFKDLCIRISPEVSRFTSVMEEDKMSISGGPSFSKDISISPEVSKFTSVIEEDKMSISGGPSFSKDFESPNLKMEHRVYGKLAHELIGPPMERSCICEPICASSTDNYPAESIVHTLDPRNREDGRESYWSSKGESSKDVSETLTYRLHTNLSVVHEIKIRPYQANFQPGNPIYSADKVRFRFGYSNSSPGFDSSSLDGSTSSDRSPCEDYVWTYISQEYPMLQEDELQSFKLPKPVLCIGDILQVELLGRVQRQRFDGLYYICVCHVYVVGRPLSSISFEVRGQPSQYILKYSEHQGHPDMPFEDTSRAGRVHALLGNITVVNFIPRDDQDSDEDGNINLFLD